MTAVIVTATNNFKIASLILNKENGLFVAVLQHKFQPHIKVQYEGCPSRIKYFLRQDFGIILK